MKTCEQWLDDNRTFEPCVIYYPHANCTEMVIRDAVTVWRLLDGDVEAGYDAETGDLIAVRMPGDQTKRN
jgi:hypothetical protein